jgi:hypothetical protein
MHPLSIFPQLLTFGLIAPTLLRIVVGIFLILAGLDRYKKVYKWASIAYFAPGLFVFIGLYTQVAVIVGIIVIAFDYFEDKKNGPISREKMFVYAFAKIILLSLLFTGPGFFAFDLPL